MKLVECFFLVVFCNKSTVNTVIASQTIKTLCQNKVFVIPVFSFFQNTKLSF